MFTIVGPKLTKEERQAKTQREKTPAGKVGKILGSIVEYTTGNLSPQYSTSVEYTRHRLYFSWKMKKAE